jgi:hypothetical protein
MTNTNNKFFAGKSNLAKLKPAIELINIPVAIVAKATTIVIRSDCANPPFNNVIRGSTVNGAGTNALMEKGDKSAKTRSSGLNPVGMIHKNGRAMKMANSNIRITLRVYLMLSLSTLLMSLSISPVLLKQSLLYEDNQKQ